MLSLRDDRISFFYCKLPKSVQPQEQDENVHRQCTGLKLVAWPMRDSVGQAAELSTDAWMTLGIRMWSMSDGLKTNSPQAWLQAGSPLAVRQAGGTFGTSGRVDSG